MKRCSKCLQDKPDEDFYRVKRRGNSLHPSCKECVGKNNHRWKKKNPERVAAYSRKSNYGITDAEYTELLKKQEGTCAICRQPKKLGVDHCHTSGRIRGLLCLTCNFAIGVFGDSPVICKNAMKYLEKL